MFSKAKKKAVIQTRYFGVANLPIMH